MRLYSVYIHTSPSSKVYIGITSQPVKHRWKSGRGYRHNVFFTTAIKKYGWHAFKHEVLYEGLLRKDAEKLEIELIAKYNSTDLKFGYNIARGGNIPGPITEETRQKLRDSHKNIHPSEESRKKRSETMKKYLQTAEGKKKWRRANIGRKFSEEAKQKISKALMGHGFTQETRTKIKNTKTYTVMQLDVNKNPMCVWHGVIEISDVLKISSNSLWRVCKRNRNSLQCLYKNCYFVYVDDYLQNIQNA